MCLGNVLSPLLIRLRAPVAELVDAADSKSVIGNDVGVRVSLGAPYLGNLMGTGSEFKLRRIVWDKKRFQLIANHLDLYR
jgi:hypothetical protein